MDIGVSLSPEKCGFGPLLFAGDLEKGMQAASSLGYDGVELSLLDSARTERGNIVRRLRELDLKPLAVATGQTYLTDGYSLYNAQAAKRRRAVDRVKQHVDFAAELGCMVIIGGIRGRIETTDERRYKSLAESGLAAVAFCVEHARRSGVTLLVEPVNRYETNVVNTLEEGEELIRRLGGRGIKLLADTFHMNIEERSPHRSILASAANLGYVHFADSNRLAPGSGHIDFVSILSALQQISYGGPIVIEALPKPDDHSCARQAIRQVRTLLRDDRAG